MSGKILMGGAVVVAAAIAVLFVVQVFFGGLGLGPDVPQIPEG